MSEILRETKPIGPDGRGFTLAECLVALVVIGVLASLVLAKTSEMRDEALDAQCRANLRQWGEAVRFYALDNDGYYAIRSEFSEGSGFLGISPWLSENSGYSA